MTDEETPMPECGWETSIKLMQWLARMANTQKGLYRKMVLVLEIDSPPKLYCEQFLQRGAVTEPPAVSLQSEEKPVTVSLDGGLSCE